MHSPISELFAGGGETGELMRRMDWAGTALGPVEKWPQALKTAVRILLTSRQPMFVWWGNELINLYNDAYRSIVGGKHPGALGAPARDVWREIWSDVGPRARQAMEDNEGTYDEALELIMERNGYVEETYYTFSYSPIPNDEGGTGGIICANTDDTQRIIGERQLALLRELAARTAEARTIEDACSISARCFETNTRDLPFALIYLVDADQRAVTLKGVSGVPGGAEAAPEKIRFDDRPLWPVEEALSTGERMLVDDLKTRFRTVPTGTWQHPPDRAALIPIGISGKKGCAAVLIAGLNPFRLFDDSYQGFLRLIASQFSAALSSAHAYDEERKRAEALAELDRAKTTFFSNVSHEFRTPLMLMLGPVEDVLADSEKPLAPVHRERLTLVERNGMRMLKLVNTLLDFARIEAGRVEAVYTPTDLGSYTADLASLFRSAVERAGMTLTIQCEPGLEAYVDSEMWEKIVLNLVSNAFKYTFHGGITVSLRDAGEHLELKVSDTGIGIAEDQIARVFERFHRVEGAPGRTFEGTGIGLALVEELTRLHAGTVRVESQEGAGSTFTVTIPKGSSHLPPDRIQTASEAAVRGGAAGAFVEEALRWLPPNELAGSEEDFPSEPEESLGGSRAPAGDRPRILLADDNRDMRDYVARLLRGRYRVDTVTNGKAALNAIRSDPPDLVLSDVMMPELDGFRLVRAIREDSRIQTLPVILISARAGEEATVEGLSYGADDYLVKPFTARELSARVDSNLKLARLRAETRRAEDRVVEVLESITDGFLSVAADWRITYVNHVAATLLRQDAHNLKGKVLADAFPGPADSDLWVGLRKAMQDREPTRFESPFEPLELWTEWRVYPTGEGISAIIADVTQKRRLEEQLRQSAKLESLGVLAGGVAHDFNNLLVGVMGNASLAELMLEEDHPARQLLHETVRASERAAELTQQLLAYSGKGRFVVQPVDVASLVKENQTLLRTSISGNVQMVLDLPPNLPTVQADRAQIQQVVMNLMINAAEAIGNKPGKVIVRVKERVITAADRKSIALGLIPGRYVCLQVIDSGCGMTATTLSRIFDPFFTTKFTGRGLGLAAVQGIVRGHKGVITVESVPDEGTTFQVLIPAARGEVAAAQDGIINERLAGSGTVLIIDDDEMVRQTASQALRAHGYQTITARDGMEGLAIFEQEAHRLKAVLLDITMPVMTGEQTLPRLKKLGPRVPVILSSGFAESEVEVRLGGKGIHTFIQKPYTAAQLARAVKEAIGTAAE